MSMTTALQDDPNIIYLNPSTDYAGKENIKPIISESRWFNGEFGNSAS